MGGVYEAGAYGCPMTDDADAETRRAGTGYFIATENRGPAILLLHSWWGLTPWVRARADAWADAGYTVLVPDLLVGARPQNSAEAELELAAADMDATAHLVRSSVDAVRSLSVQPRDPIVAVGYGMGTSWALWASVRMPRSVRAVVGHYGTQNIDFDLSRSDYQLHFAGDDEIVTEDEAAETTALLGLAGRPVELHRYEGCGHGFCEPQSSAYDEQAADLAAKRCDEFIRRHLPT